MDFKMSDLREATMEMAGKILEPEGYRLNTLLKNSFEKRGTEVSNRIQFEFKERSAMVRCSRQMITFHKVENIIMEVDLPDRSMDLARKGKVLMATIEDKLSPVDCKMEDQIFTKGEGERWMAAVGKYLKNESRAFSEKYSTLPAVLNTIDRLGAEGRPWYEILSGGPDFFFRGLIISKLCNDPDYKKKVQKGDTEFIPDVGEEWVPYYEKLKVKLDSM